MNSSAMTTAFAGNSAPTAGVNKDTGFFGSLLADKKILTLFAAIVLFGFFTKIARLEYPQDFYFDEVYHGFTATVVLHGDRNAYDPWAKSPPGKAYEWTHPPLSKLIMAGMMSVFGENAFGWRIGSVIFGTLATLAAAALAFELFGSLPVAVLTGALMSLDGLLLSQSRIAMNDIYFIFFMLTALIGYVRWKRDETSMRWLYFTGMALGLALATKWTTLYVFLVLAVDLGVTAVRNRRLPPLAACLNMPVALGLLPIAIYLSSYLQYFALGYRWPEFIELFRQMWFYHTGLKATHAAHSQPWQWILNLRPVWMYVDYSVPGKIANIYNLGNSVILYGGLYAVAAAILKMEWYRSWPVAFMILVYFMLWLPWTLSPRIMFFYHYAPAVPILCIILARWLGGNLVSGEKVDRMAAKFIVAAAVLWFVVFYPDNTAIHVPQGFADAVYFSVPGWKN
ncbi:Dolichyl-phosphate-mannose--protein mannosyltransferase [Methylococcus capsulatus]|jgi:dolichyl-phosphate-mannose-protein mannosyltransferase|uniref:Polyprenol-phosphate-mannose--protein mannosyltransferase n=2 Tax=Methylococcaceae TaxID=403 RepID=A0AA35XZ44_METCP|nr:Dolichyl-phosphate-mannose--protein mannosyltransferase [Methylococcus capsulatus]